MNGTLNDQTSIYLQIAQNLENDLLRGIYLEEEQVPSTNELARRYNINPATAAKGINLLVADGILYKKRGIGMFVAAGACEKVRNKRKTAFFDSYVKEMIKESRRLGISPAELVGMVAKAAGAEQEEEEE